MQAAELCAGQVDAQVSLYSLRPRLQKSPRRPVVDARSYNAAGTIRNSSASAISSA